MKIILATDGTKYSDAAVEVLNKINLGDSDEVKIVSVVELAVPLAVDVYGGYLPDTTELEKIAKENAARILSEAVERAKAILGSKGVAVTTEILFGSPESRIVETAEETQADLIIMGSHGYKTWERMLLGSVSNSVVHHAPCSVIVVRMDTKK
ncbi:MAG: universal stress protein [Chloracidobacterium sp.]|nr:universal stress protein [Chloracidobacterium sp.]